MSQENLEVVERAVAALNERDIDRYLGCCTEDIELALAGSWRMKDYLEFREALEAVGLSEQDAHADS